MSKTNLVIVESPAKAKTIGKYLGRDYEVMASMGHIRDLPKSKLGVDIDAGFVPDYQPIKGKEEIIATLQKAASESDKVYPVSYTHLWESQMRLETHNIENTAFGVVLPQLNHGKGFLASAGVRQPHRLQGTIAQCVPAPAGHDFHRHTAFKDASVIEFVELSLFGDVYKRQDYQHSARPGAGGGGAGGSVSGLSGY